MALQTGLPQLSVVPGSVDDNDADSPTHTQAPNRLLLGIAHRPQCVKRDAELGIFSTENDENIGLCDYNKFFLRSS